MSLLSRISSFTALRKAAPLHSCYYKSANYSKDIKDEQTVYNEDEEGKLSSHEVLVDVVDLEEREYKIKRMRNKCRMTRSHRNILFNEAPTESTFDLSLKKSRCLFGRFGEASRVDPRLCFETPAEKDDRDEYNRVMYPFTVSELIKSAQAAKAEKEKGRRERDIKMGENLKKLDRWIADMRGRVAKKEEAARLAKERRERFMEELRQELGFKIDRKDPRFKDLMEKKETQFKKAAKSAKQQVQSDKRDKALKNQIQKTLEEAADTAGDNAFIDENEVEAKTEDSLDRDDDKT